MSKKDLSPGETWQAVKQSALADEAERVGKLSDEALDHELAQKGIDPAALRARGEALVNRLRAQQPADVVPLPPPRPGLSRARYVWGAAAAAAAVAILATTVSVLRSGGDVVATRHPPPEDQVRAAALRDLALASCREHRFPECARRLDEAKGIDPQGEDLAEVKDARRLLLEHSANASPRDE